MNDLIFLDHGSTSPCDPRVVEAMNPYFTEIYGNPSSHLHAQGNQASQAVDGARSDVAALVGLAKGQVVFTSGATEANNLALLGLPSAKDPERKHVLVSQIEHYSVVNTLDMLKAHGYTVEELPVDKNGVVTPEILKSRLRSDTALVSVMHANAEVGTIQPIAELAALVRETGAFFHTDATASAGLLPLRMSEWGIDAVTLSAHNFYGPKGVGALVLAEGVRPKPRSYGGWQEFGLRCGTENVPGIVGMAAAARLALAEKAEWAERQALLGRKLWKGLEEKISFIHFTGHPTDRLPGHVSFWVEHVEGESLILFLNSKNIMAASGSACGSNLKAADEDELVASHVLDAVGVPSDICAGSVTFFIGKDTTEAHIDFVLQEFSPIVERLLQMSPTYHDYLKSQKNG